MRVLSASDDKTVRLWDAATGRQLREFSQHADKVNAIAVSPDGGRVLSASNDKTMKLWNVTTGQIVRTFEGKAAITAIAFAPDGASILSGTTTEYCFRWGSWGCPHAGVPCCMRPGRQALAQLWDAATGQLVRTFEGNSWYTGGDVTPVAFSPDGARVLVGGGSLKLWDAASGELQRAFEPLSDKVEAVAFSPDGIRLVAAHGNGATLWAPATGQLLRTIKPQTDRLWSVAFSPDGKRVLAGLDKTTRLWDATTGRLLRTFTGQSDRITSVGFSPNGERALTGAIGGKLTLWDAASWRPLLSVNGYAVNSVAFSPDGARFVAAGGWMTLWDAATGQLLRKLERSTLAYLSVAFSPDGTRVLTGSNDKTAKLWDAATGEIVRSFEAGSEITSVAFSPDGASILAASGRAVMLWDGATGRLRRSFEGHAAGITSVAFSPDGTRVLAGAHDRTLKLWDTATGELVRGFGDRRHGQPPAGKEWATGRPSVAFSRDGSRVLAGTTDGTARLWNVSAGELLATLLGASDGEWAAFTPEGFFEASNDGAKLISIVRDLAVVAMDRAYKTLHRPDLVQEKLAGDPRGKVKAAAEKLDLD